MRKIDYLKLSLKSNVFRHKAWCIRAFSITRDDKEPLTKYPYMLISREWGYAYLDENLQEQKIEDAPPKQPLFRFKDVIEVDASWAENITEKMQSTVGRILFNHFCVIRSFGNKFPYINKRVSVSDMEAIIAKKFESTPKNESDRSNQMFYVDEYIRFCNSLKDFEFFSQLASWSATRKSVIPPKGIEAFKKDLLKKYEGKLHDPVEVAKFEAELLAFDDEFLKDDPAYGTFLAGKIKNTARKKLFLGMGNELGFTEKQGENLVTNSLHEGWPTDPQQYTAMMNGLRFGSFSRGSETVKGGVSAKYLLRAANNFIIVSKDCGSKIGIRRTYNDKNVKLLVGRYIVQNNQSVLVENEEQAKPYVGKPLRVRSPMYCKLAGDTLCTVCAGKRLSMYPTGLTIPLTEVSSILLTAALKIMHTTGTKTAKLNIHEAFS